METHSPQSHDLTAGQAHAMKSTDGDADDDPVRVEHEEILARYNRQLASARSECGRLEAINDAAAVASERAGVRHDDVLVELGRRVYEQQVRVDACETEKRRLTGLVAARQAASDEACERRQAQYDRALAGLNSDRAYKESKWKFMDENRRHRTNLIDAMHSASEHVNYLNEILRENLYAAGQSLVCRKVGLNYEQTSEIENLFKTIIINHECNQNDSILNITNYYATIEEMIKIQKQNSITREELKTFVKKYEDKKLDIILQNDELVMLISLENSLDERIYNLTKQNVIANEERMELITEINTNNKIMLEENVNNIQTTRVLENDVQTTNDSFDDLQQDIIIVNELLEQKCNYITKFIDEVVKIVHEIKKYAIGEKHLTDNPTNIDWLLNMIRPLVHNIKTIKSIKESNNHNLFDSKDFKKYLKEFRVIESVTNVLLNLYELEVRPTDPLDYIRTHMTETTNEREELEALTSKRDNMVTEIQEMEEENMNLEDTIKELKNKYE